jgi:hypothetical protein
MGVPWYAAPVPSSDPRVRRFGRYLLCGEIASDGMITVCFGRLLGPAGFSRTVAPVAAFALAALTALVVFAPAAAAQTAPAAAVDQCLADHVAGQEARLDTHLLVARARFRACAQASCPGPVAQACTDFLRELEPRISSLVLTARDTDGHDVVDGTLSLDGDVVPRAAWGRARDVEPGTHEIKLERGGQVIAHTTVVVTEGEKNRRAALTVTASPAAAAKPARATASDPLGTAGLVSAAVGLGAFLGSNILGISAISEYGHLKTSCAPTCTDAAVAGTRTKALVSDVLLGSAIALVVAGGFAVFFAHPSPPRAKPQAAAMPYVVLGDRGGLVGVVVKAF